MKKKLLLLLTSTLTLSAGIAAVAISYRNESLFSVRGQNEPTDFLIDYSSVEHIEDSKYEVLLRSNKGASIRVRVEGVSYNSNRFHPLGGENDVYIYNLDDIRGVGGFGLLLSNGNYSSISSDTMFSYNEINFTDVLDGKYQDLIFKHDDGSDNYYQVAYSTATVEALANTRYFYSHIAASSSASIEQIAARSICAAYPPEIDVGENDGTFSEEDLATFNSLYGSSIGITKAGNPAYYFSSRAMYQYYNKGGLSPFESVLLDKGFVNTMNVGEEYIYQKKDGGKVHTFAIFAEDCGAYAQIEVEYTDTMDYIEQVTEWPADYINNALINHKNLVPALSSEIIEEYIQSFQVATNTMGSENMIAIIPTLKVEATEQVATAIATAYMSQFDKSVWTVGNIEANYQDGFLEVFLEYYDGQLMLIIGETIVNDTSPTASEIASAIHHDNSEDIYVVSGGEGAAYVGSGSYYRIYNYANNAFENAISDLENAGYEISSYYSSDVYLKKYVGGLGDYIEVELYSGTYDGKQCIRVEYSLEISEKEEFDSFYELLSSLYYFSDEVNLHIANNIELDSSYELYRVDDYIIVKNAGNELISQFASVYSDKYVEAFNAYNLENDQYLKLTLIDGSVRITFISYGDVEFSSYTHFNDFFDARLSAFSYDSSIAIHLAETDNVPARFALKNESRECYFGTKAEVEAFKTFLTNKINASLLYKYSTYLDMFINETTGCGIELSVYSYYDVYYLEIELSQSNEFKDYQSYNELGLGSIALLSNFPSFVSDEQKNEKCFVNLTQTEYSVSLEVSKTNSFSQSYLQDLVTAGFSQVSNYVYVKLIDGYMHMFVFGGESENTYQISFQKSPSQYMNHDELFASLGEEAAAYLDSFGFSTCFNSSSKVYNGESYNDYHTIVVCGAEEIQNYKNYLLNNGYEFVDNPNIGMENFYIQSNESKDSFKGVQFEDYGAVAELSFNNLEIPFVSWDDVLTAMSSSSHNYAAYSEYIPYPDDGEGNLYLCSSASSTSLTLLVNKNYNMNAYIHKIQADPNFDYKNSYGQYDVYYMNDGTIQIRDNVVYFIVNINVSERYDGNSMKNAIVVGEGSEDIVLRQNFTYFAFTPESSGMYYLYLSTSASTYARVTDANNDFYESNWYYPGSNSYISIDAEAGKTYYIALRSETSSVIDATLRIINVDYDGMSFDDAIVLTEGTKNVELRGMKTYFAFTPEEAGEYYFLSNCSNPVNGSLTYSKTDYDTVGYNSYGTAGGGQFYFTANLEAGHTYYLAAYCPLNISSELVPVDATLTVGKTSELVVSHPGEDYASAISVTNETLHTTFYNQSTYFKYECNETGNKYICVDSDYQNAQLFVFDEEYNFIVARWLSSNTTFMDVYFEKGKTYYFEVRLEGVEYPLFQASASIKVDAPDTSYPGAEYSTAPDIYVGETDVVLRDYETYFKFIPESDGYYYFASQSEADTYGYIFNNDEGIIKGDGDGTGIYQFMFGCYLTGGETYYLSARTDTFNPFSTSESTLIIGTYVPESYQGQTEETAIVVNLGENDVTYRDSANITYLEFTTGDAGYYVFEFGCEKDFYTCIYDEDLNSIHNESFYKYGSVREFLEANTTYYIGVYSNSHNPFYKYDGALNISYIERHTGDTFANAITLSKDNSDTYTIYSTPTYFVLSPDGYGMYIFETTSDALFRYYFYDENYVMQSSGFGHNYSHLDKTLESGTYYYVIETQNSETAEATVGVSFVDLQYNGYNMEHAIVADVGENDVNYRITATYFVFTAEEAGTYEFSSDCYMDTRVIIYNSNGGYINENDDGGENNNFYIALDLEEGQTIYLCVTSLSGGFNDAFSGTLIISQVNQ